MAYLIHKYKVQEFELASILGKKQFQPSMLQPLDEDFEEVKVNGTR